MTDGVDERIMHEYIYLRNCGVARLILATVRLYEMKASLGLFRGRGLLRARSAVNFPRSIVHPYINQVEKKKKNELGRRRKDSRCWAAGKIAPGPRGPCHCQLPPHACTS
jgi:hypothetical protein